jgi:hypothetical protein
MNNCSTCYTSSSSGTGKCECWSGYPDKDPDPMQLYCVSNSVNCAVEDASSCQACYNNAEFSGGQCVCKAGFTDTIAGAGLRCIDTALIGCSSGFYESSSSPLTCSGKLYSACTEPCSTCSGSATHCLSCLSANSAVSGGVCSCLPGYNDDVFTPDVLDCFTNSSPCTLPCATCTGVLTECLTCVGSNTQATGGVCSCSPHFYDSESSTSTLTCTGMS